MRASLDGISVDKKLAVEIKCGESAYRKASQSGKVPDYYFGQVQHILAVTGYDDLDFFCHWPGNPDVLIPVRRHKGYIDQLIMKEEAFWKKVVAGRGVR